MDEDGAHAAAVSSARIRALAFRRQSDRPFNMIVDRPFFCAIEERRSGALLFVGTIHDPTV